MESHDITRTYELEYLVLSIMVYHFIPTSFADLTQMLLVDANLRRCMWLMYACPYTSEVDPDTSGRNCRTAYMATYPLGILQSVQPSGSPLISPLLCCFSRYSSSGGCFPSYRYPCCSRACNMLYWMPTPLIQSHYDNADA